MPYAFDVSGEVDGRRRQTSESPRVPIHNPAKPSPFVVAVNLRAASSRYAAESPVAPNRHCHRQTVGLWRTRYSRTRTGDCRDASRPGRPRAFPL